MQGLLAERGVMADGLFVGREGLLGRAAQPVGFILSRIVLDEAEILTVAIRPECRGRGYSRSLLSRHLDELSRRGVAPACGRAALRTPRLPWRTASSITASVSAEPMRRSAPAAA